MGHVDPREASGCRTERLEGAIELRIPRGSPPPVQVGGAEAMRRLEPARLQRLEVARQEDRLGACKPCPTRWCDLVAEAARGRLEVARVLVDRPARPLPDREEPRVGRPWSRPCANE